MMTESKIQKVGKEDIKAPELQPGGTAIVLQRHEKYDRDRSAEAAGSIFSEDAEAAHQRDVQFFEDLMAQEQEDGVETMVLFVSSDTQYAGKGRRSMETAQLAQDAAAEVMSSAGIDPNERIINFNTKYNTGRFEETDQDIRPMKGIVEPKIFDDNPEFVKELGRRFNPPEHQELIEARRTDVQLTPAAFGAYEADLPEVRELLEEHGAEGVYDILDRTKKTIRVLERYSKIFHANNPGKKLVIWAASHYDTISPLVKDATATEFSEFVAVDYGGGVVIDLPPDGGEAMLEAQGVRVAIPLGKVSVDASSRTS